MYYNIEGRKLRETTEEVNVQKKRKKKNFVLFCLFAVNVRSSVQRL